MKCLFRGHDWKVIEKTSTPSRPMSDLALLNCSEYMAERLLMGMTTVLLQCSGCHKVRKEEMLGKALL